MRIAVISEADMIWSLSAWERTVPLLIKDGHHVLGIWTCPAALSKLRGRDIPRWYLRTFGLPDFIKLGMFGATAQLRRLAGLISGTHLRSFRSLAARYNATYGECRSPNDCSFVKWLEASDIDVLLITVSFILDQKALAAPKIGTINKHAAALPANKGLFPYFWARLKGSSQGVSYHLVSSGIDEGRILVQDLSVPSDCLSSMIAFYFYVFATFPERIRESVEILAGARPASIPDCVDAASYYGLPSRDDVATFKKQGGRIIRVGDIKRAFNL